jgi:hypothetical protein
MSERGRGGDADDFGQLEYSVREPKEGQKGERGER